MKHVFLVFQLAFGHSEKMASLLPSCGHVTKSAPSQYPASSSGIGMRLETRQPIQTACGNYACLVSNVKRYCQVESKSN